MSAITSSNVTITRSYEVVDRAGWVQEKVSDLKIVLAGQGGTKGDIPASALGFASIRYVIGGELNNSGTMTGVPGFAYDDASGIFPVDLTQATDANRANPANQTGTWYVRVVGQPST